MNISASGLLVPEGIVCPDISASGLLVPKGIVCPVVCALKPTLLVVDICIF